MFTGIIEAVGRVESRREAAGKDRLGIDAPTIAAGLNVGGSVALNGVCLTAVAVRAGLFEVEAVAETLARSCLGDLSVGDAVNLERPVAVGGRLDGHIVQGHVDGTAAVRSITPDGASRRLWFDAPRDLNRYLVEKGSVAVDGVSLTVSAVDESGFEVVLVPHTLGATALDDRAHGAGVNVEVDVLAKYVERLLEARQ